MLYVALYLLFINLLTGLIFFHDKRRARLGGGRVREATLLRLALVGGWPAAKLSQILLRHKTRKQPFARLLNAIPLAHAALLGLGAAVAFSPATWIPAAQEMLVAALPDAPAAAPAESGASGTPPLRRAEGARWIKVGE